MDRLICALIYAIRQAYYGNGSSVTYAPGNCAPNGTQAVLCSAGDMLIPVSNLATSTTVTVNAYGSPDYSIYPHMQVIVAGRVIGEWDVSATSRDYTVTLPGLPTFALLAESVDYLPFGELMGWGSGATHLFTGDERDSETGLDHTLFRQYSSSLGRWSSPDPLGGDPTDPQTLNAYSYTRGNPLNYVDPLGAAKCSPDGQNGLPCPQAMESGSGSGANSDFVQWTQVPAHSPVVLQPSGHMGLGYVDFLGQFHPSDYIAPNSEAAYWLTGPGARSYVNPTSTAITNTVGPAKPQKSCRIEDPVLGALESTFRLGGEVNLEDKLKAGASIYRHIVSGQTGAEGGIVVKGLVGVQATRDNPLGAGITGGAPPPQVSVTITPFYEKNLSTGSSGVPDKITLISIVAGAGFGIELNVNRMLQIANANDACRAAGGS